MRISAICLILILHSSLAFGADPGTTPLIEAAKKGYLEVVQLLVKQGAKTDTKNDLGWSPIDWAAYYGHVNVVFFLQSCMADQSEEEQCCTT